jgi:hypothetical protein
MMALLWAGWMLFGGALQTGKSVKKMTWDEVAQRALKELTEDERHSGAVYVDERELASGSTLKLDGKEIRLRGKTAVAFVDRTPQANWGHACRYLLVNLEDRGVESVEAQFPPFLREVPKTLRVVWKGEAVPEWAIAKP